jgi:hypothetical protein
MGQGWRVSSSWFDEAPAGRARPVLAGTLMENLKAVFALLIDEYAAEIGLFLVGIVALTGLILLWPL